MDYTNSNAFAGGSALAMTGGILTGTLWTAIAMVALGTAALCIARFVPRKEN